MQAVQSCCGTNSGRGKFGAARQPGPQVIDVFREHGLEYLSRHSALSAEQRHVLLDLAFCRTEAMGGNRRSCPKCGHSELHYNSCRNRHCPNCRALFRATWLSARLKRFLPVAHFLVTFTLPDSLRAIALQNPREVYKLMFAAVSAALATLGVSVLGGTMGVMATLHTWTRELLYHPHVHALVTGGALTQDNGWVASSPTFLFPHRQLAAIFRKHMLQGLVEFYDQGRLEFRGTQSALSERWAFMRLVGKLWKTKWVVDVEAAPGGARPEQALKYLARYVGGVAISDARMVSSRGDSIRFITRDSKRLTLPAEEFVRRYLMHVLPRGFTKVRYYGLYANRASAQLARAKALVPASAPSSAQVNEKPLCELETWEQRVFELTGVDPRVCPRCGCRDLVITEIPKLRRGSTKRTTDTS